MNSWSAELGACPRHSSPESAHFMVGIWLDYRDLLRFTEHTVGSGMVDVKNDGIIQK